MSESRPGILSSESENQVCFLSGICKKNDSSVLENFSARSHSRIEMLC